MSLKPHPRLLVNSVEQLRLAFSSQGDPLRAELISKLVKLADEDLLLPPLLRDEDTFDTKGKRVQFHHESRKAVSILFDCSAAFFITNLTKYLDHSVAVMKHVVRFTDWNADNKFLDTAEMSLAVSVGYDWLFHFMTPEDRQVIQLGISRHILRYAPAIYAPHIGGESDQGQLSWARKNSNGNAVCNCGMLAAALTIGESEEALMGVVLSGLQMSLSNSMSAYDPDGCWHEGPQYWSYGTQFTVLLIAMLESALGPGQRIISSLSSGFCNTALYRFHVVGPAGYSFNYGDNNQDYMSAEPHLTWLARRYGHAQVLAYSRALLTQRLFGQPARGKKHNKFDRAMALHAIWYPEKSTGDVPPPKQLDMRFGGHTELITLCSSWDNAGAGSFFVGLKGGSNGGTHGHLDLGTFVLDYGSDRFALDFGGDDYALPAYASKQHLSKRWSYMRTSNRGHNTVTLGTLTDGRFHVSRSLQKLDATAPLVRYFSGDPDAAHAVLDMSNIYEAAPNGLQAFRGVRLFNVRHQVLIQDEFIGGIDAATAEGDEAAVIAIIWRLFTTADIRVASDGRTAYLRGKQSVHEAILTISILPDPEGDNQNATFSVHSAHPDAPSPIPESQSQTVSIDEFEFEDEVEDEDQEQEQDKEYDDSFLETDMISSRGRQLTEKEKKNELQKEARREARHAQRTEEKALRRSQKNLEKDERLKKKSMGGAPKSSREKAETQFRRGVDRSKVREDPNDGVSCLVITATFSAVAGRRFVLPVLISPHDRDGDDKTTCFSPEVKPCLSWVGPLQEDDA